MAQCSVEYHQGHRVNQATALCNADQKTRIDFTFPRRGPAHQRLGGNTAPCLDVNLRLVVNTQIVRSDGLVKLNAEIAIGFGFDMILEPIDVIPFFIGCGDA